MEELISWIDDNFKPLVIILLSALVLLLTCFFIIGASVVSEVQELKEGFDLPDFSSVSEAMSKLDKLNPLLDKLPMLEELINRCDNIDCIDRVLGKIMTWPACRIGVDC